jgi:hypothetical protein
MVRDASIGFYWGASMGLTADERKMYDLLNEIETLNKELSNGFKEYDVLLGWQFLKYAQDKTYEELRNALQIDFDDLSPAKMLPRLSEAKRHLLNFISGNYVVMQNMFLELKELRESNSFDDVVVTWKRKPSTRLIQRLRNRLQHGKLLDETLRYEWRTEHHPNGAGRDVFLSLNDDTWNAILAEATVEEREYFKAINTEPAWSLKRLVEEYWADCKMLFDPIEETFKRVYKNEFDHRQGVMDKVEQVEQALEAIGVSRVVGSQ